MPTIRDEIRRRRDDDDDRVDGRELRPLTEPGSDDLLSRAVRERIERAVALALRRREDDAGG